MPEALRWLLQLLGLLVLYCCMYGGAAIVERTKRDSPRWRQRSPFQRRVLARWPGLLVGFALYLLEFLLLPH